MQKKIVDVKFDVRPIQMEYFDEWARWWLADYKQRVQASTFEGYTFTLEKLCETFGSFRLNEISPYHIETYLRATVSSGLSASYTAKCRAMLSQIFRKAEAFGMVERNPVILADPVRKHSLFDSNPYEGKKDSFTIDEVKRLYDGLPNDKIGHSIRLMLASGIRVQELLALQPSHTENIGNCYLLRIRQAVKVVKGMPNVGCPKTLGSYRDIPLPEIADESIDTLLSLNRNFLVPGLSDDAPYNPSSYRKIYYRYLDQCGVRQLSPHCCRHTYISQMQACGVDIETIKNLVGHSKKQQTQAYLHVQREIKNDAADRLNTLFCS